MEEKEQKTPKLIEFQKNTDARGKLVIAERDRDIPFEIKRFFSVYPSDCSVERGTHANRNTEFVLTCVTGSCKVKVRYKDAEETFCLDRPEIGLYLPKMTWKKMYEFSEDTVLLIFASERFDPADYIGTAEFMEFRKEKYPE